VATHIIEVRDGKVELYPDDYAAYVYRIEKEVRDEGEAVRRGATGAKPPATVFERRQKQEQLNKLRNRLRTVEKHVASLDTEKKALTKRMADEPASYTPEQGARLAEVSAALDQHETEWMTLNEQIEALATELGQKAS
jgi:ATPase subunit of ABC transporter with duplicated ATPase domains